MMGIHPFEHAGLGFAPFRCVAVYRHQGGKCMFCGNSILHQFIVRDVDSKEFIVGSDCIKKVSQEAEKTPKLLREANRLALEAEAKEWNTRLAVVRSALAQSPNTFTDKPHPYKQAGKTLRDDILFKLSGYSQQAERRKAVVLVERILALGKWSKTSPS